jgi:ribosome-binding ATPase
MLRLGIVGLPNVGKSTLFNALTSSRAAAAENYPFCTVEPNVGVVAVPDPRLERLNEVVRPKKKVPAVVEFVDIAGLVKGASQGEGLGNQFLSHIREVDAVVHVIRCFEDPDVVHVMGALELDPVRDHDIVTSELALADLAIVERRLDKTRKSARAGDKEAQQELVLLERVVDELNAGRGAREAGENDPAVKFLRQLGLLTAKPILYAANVNEDDLAAGGGQWIEKLKAAVQSHHEEAEIVLFSAKFESELAELSGEERREYLASAGVAEPGLDRLIHAGHRLLGLQTFFTVGENEVRAWTMHRGGTAFDAAGEIHSDFQRGFIRAETVAFGEFVRAGSYKAAREQGLIRSEGRDYVVQDGDILLFRFNV